MHAFRKLDDLGFDPELDVELDDAVPTLALELKLSNSLHPNNGSMANPMIRFRDIHYTDESATIVVMIYVPDRFDVTDTAPETLDEVLKHDSGSKFWYEHASKKGFAKNGRYWSTLHSGNDASGRGIPLSRLAEKIASEARRGRDGLRAYGERKRKFKSEAHRFGQRAIDALEDQVLRPIGARA